MTELEIVLMKRDNMTSEEAWKARQDMMARVLMGDDPEDVLADEGLEPDYFFDIIPEPVIYEHNIYIKGYI